MVKKVLSAVVLLSAVAAGNAAGSGFYAQAGMGKTDFSLSGLNKGSAKKIVVGKQYSDHLGAEVQYTNLGEGKLSTAGYSGKIQSTAIGANVVGSLPFNRLVVSGKLGVHRVSSKVSETSSAYRLSNTTHKYTPMIGLSVSYAFTRQLEGVVELDRFSKLTGKGYSSVSGRVSSVGMRYWF